MPLGRSRWLAAVIAGFSILINSEVAWSEQDPLTLAGALSRALKHHPEIAMLSWDAEAADGRVQQANLLPNPELSLEAEDLAGTGDLSGIDGSEISLTLEQSVELGHPRSRRVDLASAERDLIAAQSEIKRADILLETARRFVDASEMQEQVTLRRDLVRVAEDFDRSTAARVAAGKVLSTEAARSQVALAREKVQLTLAEQDLVAARTDLAAMWGETVPDFETLAADLDRLPILPSLEECLAASTQAPALAERVAETRLREATFDLLRAEAKPDLSLQGGIRYVHESNDVAFLAGVAVPLPLFDRSQGSFKESQALSNKARQAERAEGVLLHTTLQAAYARWTGLKTAAETLRGQVVPASQEVLDVTRAAYEKGKLNFLDALDSQREFFGVHEELLDVLAETHKAAFEVCRLSGIPILTEKD